MKLFKEDCKILILALEHVLVKKIKLKNNFLI